MNYAAEWDQAHKKRLMIAANPDPRFVDFVCTHYGKLSGKSRLSVHALEIGCGTGVNVEWLAEQGYYVNGFDSSPQALARAHYRLFGSKRSAWPHLIIADATKPWPYRSASIDFAFDICALENLNEDEAVLAFIQLGRVLKPGGRFFTLTASEGRDDELTTAGRVRKMTPAQAMLLCEVSGLRVEVGQVEVHTDSVGRKVENWRVHAIKSAA